MWVIQFYLSFYNLYLPLTLAVASDCSFVARGFAGEIDHLADLIKEGIQHNGFALIDILQPCISFNRVNTFKWYSERAYKIDIGSAYNAADRLNAFQKHKSGAIKSQSVLSTATKDRRKKNKYRRSPINPWSGSIPIRKLMQSCWKHSDSGSHLRQRPHK